MDILCPLLGVLIFVVLIGHGIWVFLAWILRGGAPKSDRRTFEPTLDDDRAATARYLAYLRARGTIDQEMHVRLTRIMAQDVHSVQAYLDKKQAGDEKPQMDVPASEPAAKPWQKPSELQASPEPPTAPPRWVPLGVKDEVMPKQAPAAPAEAAPVGTHSKSADLRLLEEAIPKRVPAAAPAPPPPPAEPRRPFSEVITAFMAEKNIRWGELVGGLLILCCSTALVISLWSQIEAIPILKFVIFTAVTAALFGVGLFVQHRWKLPTTGHAVLIISSLLVPLNLLAFAAFSPRGPTIGGLTLVVELPAVALFAWLTLLAGRVLLPNGPGLFACGVTILSACSLVIRFLSPLSAAGLLGVSLLPVGCYVVVTGLSLWRHSRVPCIEDDDARKLILHLAVQTFACLVPFGLLLHESGHPAEALRHLAPMGCALAGPGLVAGLLLLQRLSATAPGQMRLTATVITLVAAAVMLIGVGLAWPVPSRLVPALLLNALAALAVSRLIPHPAVHAVVAVWLTFVWLLTVHLIRGAVTWTGEDVRVLLVALFSASSGQALVGPVAACSVVAALFHRRECREPAQGYGLASLVFSLLSIALVTWFGFGRPGDPEHITWVYWLYGAGAMVGAGRLKKPWLTWAGCLLLQMAIVQMLVYTWPLRQYVWPTALLIGATACVVTTIALRLFRGGEPAVRAYANPLSGFALAVSLVAVVWMVNVLPWSPLAGFSIRMAWVSVLWVSLAIANLWPVLFTSFQLSLIAAVCTALQCHLRGLDWYRALPSPFHDPWVWQAHLLVIGGFCLAWAVARVMIAQWPTPGTSVAAAEGPVVAGSAGWRSLAMKLLEPGFPATDRWMVVVPFVAMVFLSGWSIVPGVAVEHGAGPSQVALGLHAHAVGAGSWGLLLLVAAALLLHLWEGFRGWVFPGIVVAAACGIVLAAARCEANRHVVDVWRWLASGAFLAASAAFWMRGYWLDAAMRLARCRPSRGAVSADAVRIVPDTVRLLLFVLLALPAVVLTATFMAAASVGKTPIPTAVSELHLHISLLGPTMLVIVSLMGYGASERQTGYAVAAAGLACAIVTAVELYILRQVRGRLSAEFVIWLVQLNVIASSLIAVTWQGLRTVLGRQEEQTDYPSWPLMVGRVVLGLVLALATAALCINPTGVASIVREAGTPWGIAALILVEYALLRSCRTSSANQRGHRENVWVLFGAALLACAASPLDAGNWLCFHVAMVGFAAAAGIRLWAGDKHTRGLVGGGWQETFDTAAADTCGPVRQIDHDLSCTRCGYNLRGLSPSSRCPECGSAIPASVETAVGRLTRRWSGLLTQARVQVIAGVLLCLALGTLLAMRAANDDPDRPWWSAGTMAAMSVLCMVTAVWGPRRAFAYLGGLELCLAGSVWWMVSFWPRFFDFSAAHLADLANLNVIALAAAGITWLFIERRFVLQRSPAGYTERWPAFHHAAAIVCVVAVSLLAAWAVYLAAIEATVGGMVLMCWLAWAAAVAVVLVCGVDPKSVHVSAGVYALGLAGMCQILSQAGMSSQSLAWAMSVGLAAYALIMTLAWRRWARTEPRTPAQEATTGWLPTANSILVVVSLVLALYVSLTHPSFALRMLIVISPLLCAAWAVFTAAGVKRPAMQTWAVELLVAGVVLFAWSWVSPETAAGTLHRAVGLIAAVAAATPVLAIIRMRIAAGNSWATALVRAAVAANLLAGAGLAYCCTSDALSILSNEALPLAWPAVVILILALLLAIVWCILFATRERLDPLQLDVRWKEGYVYLAEVLAGVLTLHVRASMPWLFTGVIEQYWPLLVLVLAFAAVAGQEACERYGQRVLARPLGQTGVFLPALSMLELFIDASRVHFSVVLLSTGVLYAVLAAMRRSLVMALVAAASFTGSLWYLLYRTPGLGLAEHPQLWFIPPALAVLIAAHLNRRQLDETQRRSVNYACLLVIYLSSTADVFLIGVRQAPWLPMILALLSVGGILVGIASRVRSFLLLGTGFLCLSLLTMIWHAAVDLGWTWVWYTAGIALGVAIIAVFALFEKKRNEMNALLEQVRKWGD